MWILWENFQRKTVRWPCQQVMVEGTKNAVAGTHYIAFDDPVLAEFYVVPAHSATAHIPVILKRDPSLQKGMSFCESLLEKMQISKQAIRNFLLIR